jgi:hypothetical protein
MYLSKLLSSLLSFITRVNNNLNRFLPSKLGNFKQEALFDVHKLKNAMIPSFNIFMQSF